MLREKTKQKHNKMKLHHEPMDSKAFRCCFCCHVRVGTIILGLWHLMIHILVLGCLVTSSLHPELLKNEAGTTSNTDGILVLEQDESKEYTSGPVFEIQYETPGSNQMYAGIRKADLCFAFALVLCTFLIALMMVHGAVKNRPGYLIPFFCLQVFDFCITCLTVVGYMTYAPNIKLWIVQQRLADYPIMDFLLKMDEEWLMLLFVIFFFLVLSVKAYLINMVWSCYKYIQVRNANRSVVREYHVDPDTEMLLPPKYEEAMRMSPNGSNPPPPYSE